MDQPIVDQPTVYVETSVISYLTARPNSNPGIAGRQYETQVWWDTRRDRFRLVTSRLVLDEAARGDSRAAASRLRLLDGIPLVEADAQPIERLVRLLLSDGLLPAKAADDATHIAFAAVGKVDYLLTWNCTHLANAVIRPRVERMLRAAGLAVPVICTPWELMGPPDGN